MGRTLIFNMVECFVGCVDVKTKLMISKSTAEAVAKDVTCCCQQLCCTSRTVELAQDEAVVTTKQSITGTVPWCPATGSKNSELMGTFLGVVPKILSHPVFHMFFTLSHWSDEALCDLVCLAEVISSRVPYANIQSESKLQMVKHGKATASNNCGRSAVLRWMPKVSVDVWPC